MMASKTNIFLKVFFYFLIFLLGAFPLLLTTSLLFLRDPPIWPDEAIYADTARTLMNTGRLATGIFGGAIPGLEKHAYWYPPLYFHLLAWWMKLFGTGIEAIRALSLIFAFLSLAVVGLLLQRLFKNLPIALLGMIMVSIDGWFARAARVARMDMFNFFLMTAALFCFAEGERTQKRIWYLVVGMVAAFGVLVHPLFFIALFTIGGYLLLRPGNVIKKIETAVLITTPTIVSISMWFFSMRREFNLFLLQYGLQLIRKEGIRNPFAVELFNQDVYWRTGFILYAAILGILIFSSIRYRWKHGALFATGLIVSSIALIASKEMWYVLYFQPFVSWGGISAVYFFWERKKPIAAAMLVIVTVILLINIHSFLLLRPIIGSEKYNYDVFGKKIVEQLPKQTSVFIATIPDPYFYFRKNTDLKIFEFPTVPVSKRSYKKLLDSVDFLILNMIPDKIVYEYIKNNTQRTVLVGDRNGEGYSTTVIQLVSREKRR